MDTLDVNNALRYYRMQWNVSGTVTQKGSSTDNRSVTCLMTSSAGRECDCSEWLRPRHSPTFECRHPTGSSRSVVTGRVNTASASTTSGVCASSGRTRERWRSKALTITEENPNDSRNSTGPPRRTSIGDHEGAGYHPVPIGEDDWGTSDTRPRYRSLPEVHYSGHRATDWTGPRDDPGVLAESPADVRPRPGSRLYRHQLDRTSGGGIPHKTARNSKTR